MQRKVTIWPVLLLVTGLAALATPAVLADAGANAGTAAPTTVKEDDILFYCPFDKTTEPAIHKGEADAEESVPATFIAGFKGQALLTGHQRSVTYLVKDNLSATAGTIVFWVMPVDWSATDGKFHHFFGLRDDGQAASKKAFSFLLYKYSDWPQVIAYGMDGELIGDRILRVPMDATWAPKQWHQVAFGWDKDGAALYVDGEGQSMRYREPAPTELGTEHFSIGGPYFAANATFTAIDELRIYRRRLSPEEIKSVYQADKKASQS